MKNKGFIFGLIIVCFLLIALSISVFALEDERVVCSELDIYEVNGVYILPSSASYDKIEYHSSNGSFSYNGKEYVNGETIDISKGEKVKIYDVQGIKVQINGKDKTFFICENLPFVSVETSMDLRYITKDNRDEFSITKVFDKTGKLIYSDEKNETFSEFKVRGNMTANYQKKPYQVKLGKKANLFDMGKAKTYILLANYIDSSFIRNKLAFSLAASLNMAYSPNSEFVTLFVNGECKGLYQLTEKTQINDNRIEIVDLEEKTEKLKENEKLLALRDSNIRNVKSGEVINSTILTEYTYVDYIVDPEDITGGYLVELDNLYANAEKCHFTTMNGNTYVIKSPEYATKAQVEYIATLFADMEDAIYSSDGYNTKGKHIGEYVDLESLAKFYLIEEIAKEWDAFVGSCFFYKDVDLDGITSKIYFGPMWDFDNSLGNINSGTFAKEKTEIWTNNYAKHGRPNGNNNLGHAIYENEALRPYISKYVEESANIYLDYAKDGGYIDELASYLKYGTSADKVVWGYRNRQSAFVVHEVFTDGKDDTINTGIGYVKDYIREREPALIKQLKFDAQGYYNVYLDEANFDGYLTSFIFKENNKANFVYFGSEELVITDSNGNNIDSYIEDGRVYFDMPSGDVHIKVKNTTPIETTIVTTTIEETTTTEEITTIPKETIVVETTIIETTAQETTLSEVTIIEGTETTMVEETTIGQTATETSTTLATVKEEQTTYVPDNQEGGSRVATIIIGTILFGGVLFFVIKKNRRYLGK